MKKVVCITGGSGVIGKAIATSFAKQNYSVFILSRDVQKAESAVASILREGGEVRSIQCDVLNEEKVKVAVDRVLEEAGRIDILINGAGGNLAGATIMPDQSISDIQIDEFRRVMDLNLLGTVIPTKEFLRPMINQGKGCIVNISSMAASLPLSRVIGYSASKAAIDNFTKSMAIEVLSKYGEGIRVNAIAPGFLVADQNRALLLNDDGSLTERGKTIISQTPMKRFGKPEELISTVNWLCDDASSFITGTVIPIDGGFSAFSGV